MSGRNVELTREAGRRGSAGPIEQARQPSLPSSGLPALSLLVPGGRFNKRISNLLNGHL